MKFNRIAIASAAAIGLGTVGFASASLLTVDGGTLQYGQSGVTCDADGVDVSWGLETDDNTVRSVRVSNISADCNGATLFVKVNNGATKSAVIDATSENFSISPFMSAGAVEDVKVWIEG